MDLSPVHDTGCWMPFDRELVAVAGGTREWPLCQI
jgi:hypothetical protein